MPPDRERTLLRRLGILFVMLVGVGAIAFVGMNLSHTKAPEHKQEGNEPNLTPGAPTNDADAAKTTQPN